MSPARDLDPVLSVIRSNDRFAVTTHANPDGDALGSLLALLLALRSLGKDSVMVLGEQPIPLESRFLALPGNGLVTRAPDGLTTRTLISVDCAQASRIAAKGL